MYQNKKSHDITLPYYLINKVSCCCCCTYLIMMYFYHDLYVLQPDNKCFEESSSFYNHIIRKITQRHTHSFNHFHYFESQFVLKQFIYHALPLGQCNACISGRIAFLTLFPFCRILSSRQDDNRWTFVWDLPQCFLCLFVAFYAFSADTTFVTNYTCLIFSRNHLLTKQMQINTYFHVRNFQ